MNKDVIPEFNSPGSINPQELDFLKNNSIKLDESLKNQLFNDKDYLFKFEKEIGSYFSRNPDVLEAELVYDYYIRIVRNSHLKPKTVHQLKQLSDFSAPLADYVSDEKVNLNINKIFFSNGENKLGERLGEGKAIQNLKVWHDGRLTKAQIQDLQSKLNIPTSGVFDKQTLISIIEFQTYNCDLIDGKIVLNGETYNKINKINNNKKPIEIPLGTVKVHSTTTIEPSNSMPQSDSVIDSLDDLNPQIENSFSTNLETLNVQVLDNQVDTTLPTETKIKVPKSDIDKMYKELLKEFGTIERPNGIEYIGDLTALKLLNKQAQKQYGQKLILSMQVCFSLPITNNYDEFLIKSVINYQLSKGISPISLLPQQDSLFFDYLNKEDSFPNNPARLSTMHNYKILDSQLDKFNNRTKDKDELNLAVKNNKGYDYLIKRNQHNLTIGDKDGVRKLQVLMGLPSTGIVDLVMINNIYYAQLEMKTIQRKGTIDLKVSQSGELMKYLKYKNGTILKKLLIDKLSDDHKISQISDTINERLETTTFQSTHIMNFLENIPSNIISEMILSYGLTKFDDFIIFPGDNFNSYNLAIEKMLEDHIVLFLSELSSFGLKDKLIKSKGKQYNKVTKVTRCSRTARQNLVETFGIAYEDVIKGDAQVAKNSLEAQNLMINVFGYENAENTIDSMVKEMKGNVFDIYFDKNYDAKGNKRTIQGREKYGHRCVVFVGVDGNLWCLDPYVPSSGGLKTNSPYLFKDHLFVKRYGIGISKKSYYSDKLSFYDFDNAKPA